MRLRTYVRENREAIEQFVNSQLNFVPREARCDCPKSGTDHYHTNKRKHTLVQLEEMVVNHYELVIAARKAGVPI